jgi:DNA polymerase-4
VSNLGRNDHLQLELHFDEPDHASLDAAVDAVRDRFGSASISRAVLVGKDPGITVPMLPD